MKLLSLLLLISMMPLSSWALREVEFEWEEVDGAKLYQVEIKNASFPLQKLTSKTFTFKVKITPGKYQIRGRVHGLDPRDTESDWSEWRSFDVPPAAPKPLQFNQYSYKVSSHSFLSEIPIRWDSVEGAAEYLVTLVDINGKTKKSLTLTKPELLLQLRPGYYSVTLTSRTADKLDSEPWILPQNILVQNIPVAEPQKINLEVEKSLLTFEPAPGTSVVIALERQAFLGKEWNKIEQKTTSGNSYQWTSPLKPGKYRLTLLSQNSFNEVSNPTYKEFVIKPKEQDLPP